jgi:hypothetical protein
VLVEEAWSVRHQNRAVPGPASSATARRRQQLLRQHDIYPLARYRLVRRIGVCPLRRRLLNTGILGRCSLSFLKISGDFGTAASDCSRFLAGASSADNANTSPRESRRRVRVAQASRERERGDYDKAGADGRSDLACTAAVAYAPLMEVAVVYRVHIALRDVSPKIWRRVELTTASSG